MTARAIARFTIRNETPAAYQDEVVTCGVPMKQGVAPAGTVLGVADASGVAIGEAVASATWADGSAKWAAVTIPAFSLAAGKKATVAVTRLDAPPPSHIRLTRKTNGLAVNNGRMRFRIATAGAIISTLDELTAAGWRRRARDLDLRMRVEGEDHSGDYLASLADRTVEVETQSAERVVIAIRGTHGHVGGARTVGPYVLRLTVVAGTNRLDITHSVVVDYRTSANMLRASELVVDAVVGGDQRFRFGGDDGAEVAFARQRASWAPDFRIAELYQDSATHWNLGRRVRPDLPEIYCADGLRADGWMELAGSGGRLAIATRENWQNHPKSLRADAATGRLAVSLYPERAEPLDLRRYSDTAYAHTYESPCTWDFSTVPFPFADPALGIRKTHDLALYVGEENPSARTLFLNQPPMLNWTPTYLARCKTVVPATGKEHAGWRQVLDGYITFLQREMQASGGTGYINYFDLPHGFDEAQGRWFHDFGGFGYINDEAMPTLGLWQTWMTTQRPAVLSMARAMTRHNADIDSRHLGPRAGSGSRHNVNHWGCSCYERRISMPLGKRFAYHVSLDRSIVDLAQVTMASWVRDLSPGRGVNMTCDIPALIATLLFLEETGQHDGRRWLQALADGIAAGVDEQGRMVAMMHTDAALETAQPDHDSGVISFMMFSGFGGPQAFAELAERYDHQGLRDALVRFARYQMLSAAERRQMEETDKVGVFSQDVNLFRALDLIAYAWQVTGERAFIDGMERVLSHCAVTVEQQAAPRYGVPTAGALTAPRFTRWPARPDEQERPKRNFYPLFTGYGTGHLFNISVYLHKQQGLMAISTAAEQPTEKN